MINYYKRTIIEKAILTMSETDSFLTCDIITGICNENEVAKEYREQLLVEWQRYCHDEPWFNIDDSRFTPDRIQKLKEFINSK